MKTSPRRTLNVPCFLAIVAAGFAVLASLFLAVVPTYIGQSVTAGPDGQQQVVRTTATLIQTNGNWVISLLVVPIVLTGAVLLAVRTVDYHTMLGKIVVWVPTVILWVFVAAGSFSIGTLYLPAAAVLLAAAITFSRRRNGEPNAPAAPAE